MTIDYEFVIMYSYVNFVSWKSRMTKIRTVKYLITLILVSGYFVSAQTKPTYQDNRPTVSDWISGKMPNTTSLGLIDPSRLTVNHSASFGFSGSGDQSLMQSLYATSLTYKFSSPLTLNLILGVQNLKFNNVPGLNSENSLLGGVSLDYRPNRKLHIRLEFQQSPLTTFSTGGLSGLNNESFLPVNQVNP